MPLSSFAAQHKPPKKIDPAIAAIGGSNFNSRNIERKLLLSRVIEDAAEEFKSNLEVNKLQSNMSLASKHPQQPQ